jgi:hypothetical protein
LKEFSNKKSEKIISKGLKDVQDYYKFPNVSYAELHCKTAVDGKLPKSVAENPLKFF